MIIGRTTTGLADLADLSGTGIPFVDDAISKTQKLEMALNIITPCAVIAAGCSLLLVLGISRRLR